MRRNRPSPAAPVRSVRVTDEVWGRVKQRAKQDGVTPSYVMASFIEAYADGIIDIPTVVMIYDHPEKNIKNNESKESR